MQKRPFLLSLHPMRSCIYILLSLILSIGALYAQSPRGGGQQSRISLSNSLAAGNSIPDSLLLPDSVEQKLIEVYSLTEHLGDSYITSLDTNKLNYYNRTLVEGNSLSVAYLANIGSPHQTRIFSERKEERDFIFADAYDYYITTPQNALFYDTKIPYTNITYTFAGASVSKEERLKATLATNLGRHLNIGGDFDYIYGRGFYNSNGTKLVSYRMFSSYRSDRYELNAYLSNYSFINGENGGLRDNTFVTNPDAHTINNREVNTRSYPTLYTNTWNRVRGKQVFLTHRYNLGFHRTLEGLDEESYQKEVFIPVSSFIHTLEYEDNRRHFYSSNTSVLDTIYSHRYNIDPELSDRMSSWTLKNTFAISLREGFQDWVKMGLTAFMRVEKRRFRMQAPIPGITDRPIASNSWESILPPNIPTLDFSPTNEYDEFSTYMGAELSRKQGRLLTYNARGELCFVGDDVGEFRATGELISTFDLFNKHISIKANGYLNNTTPAFFQRHHLSRYFYWDKNLSNIQRVYVGGEIASKATKTSLSAGTESMQNYTYFAANAEPEQYSSNLQVITARLKQDLHYKIFGWENELAYQLSSEQTVLPLPAVSLYSNLYMSTKLAKVLTVQLGLDIHYFTKYNAPYYEPATQQFQLQPNGQEMKVGNYPLINGYANLHLKQTRFFIMMYNLGQAVLTPNNFSLANYPLNPMHIKLGLSVNFNN